MVAKPIAVGVVGVLVLASALVLNYFVLPDEETASAVPAASPAPSATADRPATTATAPSAVGTPALIPVEPELPRLPSFDIVRVDPGGNAVIAGRGAPNTEIAVVDGDSELGRVTTDDRGEWVFVPPAMLPSGERILTLRETGENGSQSSEAVVLVIPEKGMDIAGRPTEQPSAPLAIVVPREEGSTAAARVLQAPAAGPLAQAAPPAVAEAPTTSAPTTSAPTTSAPTTSAPTTATPTTSAPTTATPAGDAPAGDTPAPAGPSIASPTTGGTATAGGPATADPATAGPATSGSTATSRAPAGSSAPDAPAADTRVAALPPQAVGGDTGARDVTTAPDKAVAPGSDAAPVLPMSAYPEARPRTPEAAAPNPAEVAVDVIDYDDKGEVVFSGRAEQGSRVEVFIDDRKVGDTQADAAGRWTMSPSEPVAPGAYQLRVDKVATSGTVEARVAFPFVRAAALTDLPGDRLVVIQPGNNLWRIATRVYGSGFRYVEIFDTNRDQIRDPDLIFPGQVFGLPRVN